jgi:hypothetical protein
VYALGRAVLTPGWAFLAALWSLLCPMAVGVREPLVVTTLFTAWSAALFAVALRARGVPALLGLGVLAGLGVLLRFETWLLVPALATAYLLGGSGRPRARFALVLAVAVLVTVPWLWRNALVTGHPFFNASSLIYHATDPFPGWTSSRTLQILDTTPLAFVAEHPGTVLQKTAINLARYARDLLLLPSAALAPFVWLAFLRPPAGRRERGVLATLAAVAIVLVGVFSPLEYAPRFLAPLVPLMTVAAAMSLSRLPVSRRFFTAGVTVISAAILGVFILGRAPEGTASLAVRDLEHLVPGAVELETGVALADSPTLYAWIWDRPAVWLPVPEDVARVRALIPGEEVALFTCALGGSDGMGPETREAYLAQGRRVAGEGCAARIRFEAAP